MSTGHQQGTQNNASVFSTFCSFSSFLSFSVFYWCLYFCVWHSHPVFCLEYVLVYCRKGLSVSDSHTDCVLKEAGLQWIWCDADLLRHQLSEFGRSKCEALQDFSLSSLCAPFLSLSASVKESDAIPSPCQTQNVAAFKFRLGFCDPESTKKIWRNVAYSVLSERWAERRAAGTHRPRPIKSPSTWSSDMKLCVLLH